MVITLIAELCSNWEGSLAIAKQMIMKAKWNGADYVKFQLYNPDTLKDHPLHSRLAATCLDEEGARTLKKYCDHADVSFLCTPFYVGAVGILEDIGVQCYKIRESDSSNEALLRAVADTGKPTFISVYRNYDITLLTELFEDRMKLLYCIPYYPVKLEDIDYFTQLTRTYLYDGISDHYPDPLSSLVAAVIMKSHGKEHITVERHVTLSHDFDTIDKKVSIDFNQFKDLRLMLDRIDRLK